MLNFKIVALVFDNVTQEVLNVMDKNTIYKFGVTLFKREI